MPPDSFEEPYLFSFLPDNHLHHSIPLSGHQIQLLPQNSLSTNTSQNLTIPQFPSYDYYHKSGEHIRPFSTQEGQFWGPTGPELQSTTILNSSISSQQITTPNFSPNHTTSIAHGTINDPSFDLFSWDTFDFETQLAAQLPAIAQIDPIQASTHQEMLRDDFPEIWPHRTEADRGPSAQPTTLQTEPRPFGMSAIQFLDPINGSSTQYPRTTSAPQSSGFHLHSTDSIESQPPLAGPLGPPLPSTIRQKSPSIPVKKRKGNNPHGRRSILRCTKCRKEHGQVPPCPCPANT
jgi:hypothetical protein